MVRTNPIVIFRLPMIPTDHFHPNAGLFGILTTLAWLRKSVIWPLPSVNFVISSLIWTSWDTAEVSVSFFGAPKHLWFCILVGAIHRFHNGSVNHSNRNSASPRWNCIVGNHEKPQMELSVRRDHGVVYTDRVITGCMTLMKNSIWRVWLLNV